MQRRRGWPRFFIAVMQGAALACSDPVSPSAPPGSEPFALVAVTPTATVGVVDGYAAHRPVIRVLDEKGRPIRGTEAVFELTGGGTIQHSKVVTIANGEASAGYWKLGTKAGDQAVTARVANLTPVVFTATAAAGPVSRVSHQGDEQFALSGSAVPEELLVRIADKFDNPVSGITATFTVLSGNGTVERATSTSGADGVATSGVWMLGPASGPQHVRAHIGASSNRWYVVFTAHACEVSGPSGCESPPCPCGSAASCGEIVFVSNRDGQAEIYSVNRDGTELTRLTNNPAVDRDPAWSPDGKRVAFVSDRSSYPEIYVMNADGSNVVRRTFTANHSASPAWSPDGSKIAFSAGGNLWWVSPEEGGGGPSRVFTAANDPGGWKINPDWSPDGSRLAFMYYLDDDESANIAVVNSDGSGFDLVTAGFGYAAYPEWSPDGKAIAVNLWRDSRVQVAILYIGGELVTVANTDLFGKVTWSPDGSLIAYSAGPVSARDLMWVKADGTGSGRIIKDGWDPDWRR